MEIKAAVNYLHIAPRKVRLVAAVVRGMDADRALAALGAMRQRAREPLVKLLRSALADGAHNFQASGSFYVKEIRVDAGAVAKRFRARAFGRAAAIRKRTSHVSLVLATRDTAGTVSWARAQRIEPVVRDAVWPGAASERARAPRGRKPETWAAQKPKMPGAIRKIFQRKVI